VYSLSAQSLVLNAGRTIYRIPVVEIAMIAAFGAQVVLGIQLLKGISKRKSRGFWHWAQFASGAYLAYFIIMHTGAALLARWMSGLDTNFYWPAGTLILTPLKYLFAPYYTLAITAFVTHVIAALHYRRPKPWQKPALALGPIAALLILLAYSGVYYQVELPAEHLEYFDGYGRLPEPDYPSTITLQQPPES